MTASPRRMWRAENRPPVRRSDPVWDIASWVIPPLGLVAIMSASGLVRRSPQLSVEASAAFLSVDTSVLIVLLGAVVFRRWQRSTPARYSWAVFAWTASAVSAAATILWVRGRGESLGAILLPLVLCSVVILLCVLLLLSTYWPRRGSTSESSR